MEVPEPPECPVCLNPYDAVSTIPRVLSCGHSTCEVCISQLANPFPSTIRCPSCTQLVKLPDRISFLPKNIDLLRLSSSLQNVPDRPTKVNSQKSPSVSSEIDQNDNLFMRNLWSREFYLHWKNWILPSESILLEKQLESEDVLLSVCCGNIVKNVTNSSNFYDRPVLRENCEVSLVKVGVFRDDQIQKEEKDGCLRNNSCKFVYSYEAKIIKLLFSMRESERDQLNSILNSSFKVSKIGRIFGLWCNDETDFVYMVCERFKRGLVKSTGELENGFLGTIEEQTERKIVGFGIIGMDICEVVMDLHVEGLIVGCLAASCFALNELSHVLADFGQILVMGRKVCRMVAGHNDLQDEAFQKYLFVCPEMLIELLRNEGIKVEDETLRYEVGKGSDVWSLSCVLLWLLAGEQFAEKMQAYYNCLLSSVTGQEVCNLVNLYTGWKEKFVASLQMNLTAELKPLRDVLVKCLDIDPCRRPAVLDVWKCIRSLIVTPLFEVLPYSQTELVSECPVDCICLSNLCHSVMDTKTPCALEEDENGRENAYQDEESNIHGDIVDGLSSGNVKCIDLKAHLDCITGLAVGGGFLFSSSHDKIINVWSLQDFSHVHSFKRHEHRITAVVYVDVGEPVCITADIGGVICIWGARFPFDTTPSNIIVEQKDWRYSGIHALAISDHGCLYSGSGDKLIKAWSLQDYSLLCTMIGHKSVVSSLAVCSSILYSGSWDGTVRLWSLNDHSPLAVLGENKHGNLGSVLSLTVDKNLLFVAHENGNMTIWYDDVLLKSSKVHDGAIFSISKKGKWVFTGGWDKTINMQMLSGDGSQVQAIPMGSVSCGSVVTALLYWQGKLFVGQADKIVKVYHSGV